MRAIQTTFGFAIVILGLVLVMLTSGMISLTMLGLVGVALWLSALVFSVAGIAGHQRMPWLTSLFIPGALAFAIGGVLMYTERAGVQVWAYLWTVPVVALGLAFLGMYWLGPHVRWLRWIGTLIGGVGVLLFALFFTALSPEPSARIIGPIVLIGLGLVFAIGALVPRR